MINRLYRCLSLLVIAGIISGCSNTGLNTEYGRVSGRFGKNSINGTGILYEMFQQRGFSVRRYKRISPRINRFDTVVWIPNSTSCPQQEAVDALELWLDEEEGRTLIYVGRSYTADTDYFTQIASQSIEGINEKELRRRLAESMIKQDRDSRRVAANDESLSCDWFTLKNSKRRKAKTVSGELVASGETDSASIELATLLEPAKESLEKQGKTSTTILKADDHDFAYSIQYDPEDEYESKLILVGNASFLVNYGLINKENRRLAGALIDQCTNSSVVFLESGPGDIRVSDASYNNHNNWAWIAQPPLRYIVPHLLLWGVLFCFVYFPIFGRPKSIKKNQESSFGAHIAAMGKLLQRSKKSESALENVNQFRKNVLRESGVKKE